ncbi:hypothetical protein [Phaffia rhodozyma]|uniref:Uncharacterized protein n=1 Tax=Phaffia rhodozyma TaxID=264483 RepID=A0A0F7SFV4_PHARH|nr:hypothetical protein [Phaffia rhodozyma]
MTSRFIAHSSRRAPQNLALSAPSFHLSSGYTTRSFRRQSTFFHPWPSIKGKGVLRDLSDASGTYQILGARPFSTCLLSSRSPSRRNSRSVGLRHPVKNYRSSIDVSLFHPGVWEYELNDASRTTRSSSSGRKTQIDQSNSNPEHIPFFQPSPSSSSSPRSSTVWHPTPHLQHHTYIVPQEIQPTYDPPMDAIEPPVSFRIQSILYHTSSPVAAFEPERIILPLLFSSSEPLDRLGIASEDFEQLVKCLVEQVKNENTELRDECARFVLRLVGQRPGLGSEVIGWAVQAALVLARKSQDFTPVRELYQHLSPDASLALHAPFLLALLSARNRLLSIEAVERFLILTQKQKFLAHHLADPKSYQRLFQKIFRHLATSREIEWMKKMIKRLDWLASQLKRHNSLCVAQQKMFSSIASFILTTCDGHWSISSNSVFAARDDPSSSQLIDDSLSIYAMLISCQTIHLRSSSLVQFAFTFSSTRPACLVLTHPRINTRHFHLLAYKLIRSVDESGDEHTSFYGMRSFGQDLIEAIGKSVAATDRVISSDLLHTLLAFWIDLNQASEAAKLYLTIYRPSLTQSCTPAPPVHLSMILIRALLPSRTPVCLDLAASIFDLIPMLDRTLELHNDLIRAGNLTFSTRSAANAFTDQIERSLNSHPKIKPDVRTTEAFLSAPPMFYNPADPAERAVGRAEHALRDEIRSSLFENYFRLALNEGYAFRQETWALMIRAVGADVGPLEAEEVIDWYALHGGQVGKLIVNSLLKNEGTRRRRVGNSLMRSMMEVMVKMKKSFPWFRPDWNTLTILIQVFVRWDADFPTGPFRRLFHQTMVLNQIPGASLFKSSFLPVSTSSSSSSNFRSSSCSSSISANRFYTSASASFSTSISTLTSLSESTPASPIAASELTQRFPLDLDPDSTSLSLEEHIVPLYDLFIQGFEKREDYEAAEWAREGKRMARALEWEERRKRRRTEGGEGRRSS